MTNTIKSTRRNGFCFAILFVILGQLAIDIYLPSLPSISKDLHSDHAMAQLSITTFLLGSILSQLLYGPLSDRFGRRPILLVGIGIFFFTCVGTTMTSSGVTLLYLRLAQGLGIGAAVLMARVIMRDLFEGKELVRKLSVLGLAWVCVPMIAPVIGGYIQQYLGWRFNFILLALSSFIIWTMLFWKFRETKDRKKAQPIHIRAIIKNYRVIFLDRRAIGYFLSAIFLYGMLAAFYTESPFLLQNLLHLSPIHYGWTVLLILLSYAIGLLLNARLIHYYDKINIIKMSLCLILLISILNCIISIYLQMTFLLFVIPMFLIFINLALVSTNCLAAVLSSFPTVSGSASALYGTAIFTGGVLASSIVSLLPKTTFWPFSIVILLHCIVALFILRKFTF